MVLKFNATEVWVLPVQTQNVHVLMHKHYTEALHFKRKLIEIRYGFCRVALKLKAPRYGIYRVALK